MAGIVTARPAAGNRTDHWLLWRALIYSVCRRDLVKSGRRRRNSLGNAQAKGPLTLISSGERPEGPTEGECGLEATDLSGNQGQRGGRRYSLPPFFYFFLTGRITWVQRHRITTSTWKQALESSISAAGICRCTMDRKKKNIMRCDSMPVYLMSPT